MKSLRFSILLVSVFFVSGCGELTTSSSSNSESDQSDVLTLDSLKSAIDSGKVEGYSEDNEPSSNYLAVTNYIRSLPIICNDSRGFKGPVRELQWSNELEEAAQEHSNDMSENNFLSHTGSDGSTYKQRMQEHGFDGTNYSENIAYVQKGGISYSGDEWLERMVAWVNDDHGHCSNLMDPNYTHTGMAEAKSEDDNSVTIYWTQDFANKNN